MKLDIKSPRSSDEATLMNARKKEKRKILNESRKPRNDAEWVNLSEHMVNWTKANPVKNILAYGLRHGYTWSQFKAWRRESEILSRALEDCSQIILERREEYLEGKDKLYLQYIKELPTYNPIYADYEADIKRTEADTNAKAALNVYRLGVKETQEGLEYKAKKEKGNK